MRQVDVESTAQVGVAIHADHRGLLTIRSAGRLTIRKGRVSAGAEGVAGEGVQRNEIRFHLA
ncbi:hypothetical protein ACGF12_27905 [Kitasatospora sp. NPDC048296]|uniref:hypothetical protein n=1 Tax=Kitasatospora sp. NPDC048296 TaxID=3364048 RepID=UPI00371824A1